MSNPAKPPRLWKRHERRDSSGRVARSAIWVILFFGDNNLSEINGAVCREYASMRAAINHHLNEGLHNAIVKVTIPVT